MKSAITRIIVYALTLSATRVATVEAALLVAAAPEGAPVTQARYAVRLREPGGEWKAAPVYAFFQQRDYNKALTTESQFATFESSGAVEVEVTVTGAAKAPVLRPLRHALAVKQEGAALRFTMTDATRQLCLELDGDPRHPLLLFSSPLETDAPKPGDKRVTYFGPGYHKVKPIERPGYFEWAKGMTIYLAPGAVVESSLAIIQNEGVTIRGRGILFTPHGEGKKPGDVPLKIDTSKHVRVEGIVVVSRADQWSLHVTKSRNVTFENFHLLSEIRDGLDILNSQDVTVRDCFIMAHDDALCLKGMWFGGGQPVENVLVERCILANMGGGNGIELGFEANAPVFRQVTFRDSDLIYSLPNGEKPDPAWPEGALTIHNHNTQGGVAASVREVLYDDLRIEELQDDYLIDLHPLGGSTNSVLSGVTFRNIRQVGGSARPSRVMGRKDFPADNVTIEGLEILGRRVTTLNDAGVSTNGFVSDVQVREASQRTIRP
jgi:hypothetical protein